MRVNIETAQNVFIEYEIASIGDRIIGYLIDLVIFIAILIIGLLIVDNTLEGDAKIVGSFLVFIPTLFYDLVFETLFDGRSPGKMAMKMKVIDLSGKQPSIGAYILRWMMRPVDFLLFSGAVAFMSVIIGGKGQRLGDLVAGTTVVKTDRSDKFSNVLFPEFDESYEVSFPQVTQLQDRDINIIKEVMRRYNRNREGSALRQLSARVKETLQIESELSHYKFLDKIVKDYHHLSSAE